MSHEIIAGIRLNLYEATILAKERFILFDREGSLTRIEHGLDQYAHTHNQKVYFDGVYFYIGSKVSQPIDGNVDISWCQGQGTCAMYSAHSLQEL